jgi:RHS repeat-associated protein
MKGYRPAWRRSRSVRVRWFSILTVVVLTAGLLQWVPGAFGAAGQDGIDPPTLQLLPPGEPLPPPPDADREEVPGWTPDGPLDPPVAEPPKIEGTPEEIIANLTDGVSSLTENGTVYDVNGAGHLAAVYAQPINYQDAEGTWQPISTDLVSDGKGGVVNEANAFTTTFPDSLSSTDPIEMAMASGSITLVPTGMDGAKESEKVADDELSYDLDPGLTLSYTTTALGFREVATLAANPGKDFSLSFDLSSKDLSFKQDSESGEITILDASGTVVATLPGPVAWDSSTDPKTGEPAYGAATSTLKDNGGGSYTLTTTVDQKFLDDATYPVMVDPTTVQSNPNRDGWVNSGTPSTSYETDTQLRAGSYSGTSRYTFVQFYLNHDDLNPRANRIVYDATLEMWPTIVTNSAIDVNVKRVTEDWPTGNLTWNNKPDVGSTVWASDHGGYDWYVFDLTDLYQQLEDTNNPGYDTNHGIRIGGASSTPPDDNYHAFASAEYTPSSGRPVLFLTFNDRPDKPSLNTPADLATITTSSPTLKITHPVTDRNGDPVMVNYQLSTTSSFTSTEASSGWIDDGDNWTVPAGVLKDGQTYYWRVQSWDVCDPASLGMCADEGPGEYVDFQASTARSFKVSLDHLGTEDTWPMWTDALGNGTSLNVHEAAGNLYLDAPLDSIPTPDGALDLSLAYNSQGLDDIGLGPGWVVAAGPDSDPGDLPASLKSIDGGDAMKITRRDGNSLTFSKTDNGSSDFYSGGGAGSGTIKENKDGSWLYTTSDGSIYTFDASKNLSAAAPATTTDSGTSFTYSFDASGKIQWIKDTLANQITFTWNAASGELLKIHRWDGLDWHVYGSGTPAKITSVADPSGGTVQFSYDVTNGLLSGITDGEGRAASVGYTAPTGGIPPLPQVAWVQHPGATSSDRTTFTYTGSPYLGQLATRTTIADPRADDAGNDPARYTTIVDFDTQGLPITIQAPANTLGQVATTRMLWDTNGSLTCSRGPAANAYDASLSLTPKCTATNPAETDPLQTQYDYNNKAPYRIESKTGPAPFTDGSGTRPVTTYAYDEGFTGLYTEKYDNDSLSGIPTDTETQGTINQDWGTGHPSGLTGDDTFSLRWTGWLTLAATKTYKFRLWSDDGSTLMIGKQVLTDCFGTTQSPWQKNCGGGDVSKKLWKGKYPIAVQYQEKTGSAKVKLEWDQGTGSWETVPSSVLTPNLGDLTSEVNPIGLTTTYGYANDDYKVRRLPSTVTRTGTGLSSSRTTTYTYDSYGRVLTDADGAGTITNTYGDGAGGGDQRCLTKVMDRASAETDYQCSSTGDVTQTTVVVPAVDLQSGQNRVTTKTYDKLGRPLTVQTVDGTTTRTITNTYDHSGFLTQIEDKVQISGGSTTTRTTVRVADTAGRLWKETLPDPDGGGPLASPQIVHIYDQVGNETDTTDARGKHWVKVYDGSGRVVSSKDPYNNATITVYDDDGSAVSGGYSAGTPGIPLTTVTDPAGVATKTAFDLLGRKTSEKLGNPTAGTWLSPTTYAYDAGGNVTSITSPTGVTTSSAYNAAGEPTSVTVPWLNPSTGLTEQVSTTSVYDTAGRVTSVTDPKSHTTAYTYDGAGRILTTDPPGTVGAWTYVYDKAGERVTVTDPDSRVRHWTYDALGRLATYRETRSGSTNVDLSYGYDGFSELTTVGVPAYGSGSAFTQRFEYDSLGQRTRRYVTSGSANDESFAYDAAGNMTSAVHGSTTTSISYDDAGRLSTVTQSSLTTTNTYTANRLTSRADPAGTTSFHYDNYGRIDGITDPLSGTQATNYTYNDASQPLTRTDPAGLKATRTFDSSGALASESVAPSGGGSTLASYAYTYDKAGNVATLAQSFPSGAGNTDAGTWTYTNDEQDRLTYASLAKSGGGTATLAYGYDGAGNRTSVAVNGGTAVTTSFDTASYPSSSSDGTSYTFDALGDLLSMSGGPRTWTFTYDPWSRTTQAAGAGGTPTVTYGYDALDRAITRTKSGVTTTRAYVGLSEDVATSVTSGTTTKYAYSLSGPLGSKVGTGAAKSYIPNLHGDLGLVATSAGGITGTVAYGPYGDKQVTTGDGTTAPISFQSDFTDADTGLVDAGTRLFDPVSGRFTARDVLFGEAKWGISLNQFVYGGDNPLTRDDPTGMCMYDCFGIIYDGTQRGNGGRNVSTNQNYNRAGTDETDYHPPSAGVPPAPPAPPPAVAPITVSRLVAGRKAPTSFRCPSIGRCVLEGMALGGAGAVLPPFARNLYPRVPRAVRDDVLGEGVTCFYCGREADTVDHVIAYKKFHDEGMSLDEARGLVNSEENLVAACQPCNSSKGARDIGGGPGEFYPEEPTPGFEYWFDQGGYVSLFDLFFGGGAYHDK